MYYTRKQHYSMLYNVYHDGRSTMLLPCMHV